MYAIRSYYALARTIGGGNADLVLAGGNICWEGRLLARLVRGRSLLDPRIDVTQPLKQLPQPTRNALMTSLEGWLRNLLKPLYPLNKMQEEGSTEDAGPELP